MSHICVCMQMHVSHEFATRCLLVVIPSFCKFNRTACDIIDSLAFPGTHVLTYINYEYKMDQ